MPGVRKPTPIEAFDLTMQDAHHLLKLVKGFTNQRHRRMRRELREKVGEALRVPDYKQAQLDCLESSDIFVLFQPGSRLARADFLDARPLLRQAIVAACAAFETYLGDKAMTKVGPLLQSHEKLTARLKRVPLTLGDFVEIEDDYKRTGWGVRRRVVEPYVREQASTAPNKIGELLSMIGVGDWSRKVDAERKVPAGETIRFLDELTARRNKIAHEGDRVGRGRGQISVAHLESVLEGLESIVEAIESTVG